MAKTKKKRAGVSMDSIRSYKPEISLSEKELSAIKHWKVGGKYRIEMNVEQVSMSKDQYGDGGFSARFKVLSVKVVGGKGKAPSAGNTKVDEEKNDEHTKYGY